MRRNHLEVLIGLHNLVQLVAIVGLVANDALGPLGWSYIIEEVSGLGESPESCFERANETANRAVDLEMDPLLCAASWKNKLQAGPFHPEYLSSS